MLKLTHFAINRATTNNHGEPVYINPFRISFMEQRNLGVVLTNEDYNNQPRDRLMETATLITFQGDDALLVQESLETIAGLIEDIVG